MRIASSRLWPCTRDVTENKPARIAHRQRMIKSIPVAIKNDDLNRGADAKLQVLETNRRVVCQEGQVDLAGLGLG